MMRAFAIRPFRPNGQMKISFQKITGSNIRRCSIKRFDDGSAYVTGLEIDAIFKPSPEAVAKAIAHVGQLGYHRVDKIVRPASV
jgi:hypothetical protein